MTGAPMSPKKAFDAGDYRRARELASEVLNDAGATQKAKDSARAVLEKTSPPPLAKYIFLMTAVLLALLTFFWIGESRRHPADQAAQPAAAPPATSAP